MLRSASQLKLCWMHPCSKAGAANSLWTSAVLFAPSCLEWRTADARPRLPSAQCLHVHPLPPTPQGGYKAFWRSFSELCEGEYVPMDHPDYTHQLKVRGGACLPTLWARSDNLHWVLTTADLLKQQWNPACTPLHPSPPHRSTRLLSSAGVPQRGEAGMGAHHPHICSQAAPAAALIPAAPERGASRGWQQGRC